MKYGIFSLFSVVLLFSCNNDDNGPSVKTVPPRLLSEVAPENDKEIKEFLETHFYNYEEFQNPPADFDYKIKIDTLSGNNADKESLWNQMTPVEVKVSSNQLGLSEEENDISHTYYYLIAREGKGAAPTVADSTFLSYEGQLLDGTKFIASGSFVWQELPFTERGYANGVSKIKAGTKAGLVVDNDGSFKYTDSGIGLIVMPSGLAYFSVGSPGIPSYSSLIFSIEVGTFIADTDNDNDGIPSIKEDLNNNGYLFDDNTDVQSEIDAGLRVRFANFQDTDDDGDGVSTRNEITNENGEIVTPYPDSNNDGTPDYLDPDIN